MFSILGYEFADKGYYLNLPKSIDRLSHVNELIEKYNIINLHRFESLTDELHVFSCTKTHLEVFKKAKEENLSIIFVAEDDFNIEETSYYPNERIPFTKIIDSVYNEMLNVEWDVILFGCNPKETMTMVTESLYRIPKSSGAWAYLIKKRAYEYILENLNYRRDYLAIDDYLPHLNSLGFTTLTTVPIMINHGVGFVSTLQPNAPVNYDIWIQGNYHNFVYETTEFKEKNNKIN